jgi:hypothetical protein
MFAFRSKWAAATGLALVGATTATVYHQRTCSTNDDDDGTISLVIHSPASLCTFNCFPNAVYPCFSKQSEKKVFTLFLPPRSKTKGTSWSSHGCDTQATRNYCVSCGIPVRSEGEIKFPDWNISPPPPLESYPTTFSLIHVFFFLLLHSLHHSSKNK